jgi:uncharacterized membrane protein
MTTKKYHILLALFLLALLASAVLSFATTSQVCTFKIGCDVVQNSSYSYTFGIKNSYFGVVIFLFLTCLTYSQIKNPSDTKRNWIHCWTILGSMGALYLLYIQQFVLHAYCEYCLVVDFSTLAALITILILWKK